jgi:hypothetical protein
MSHFRVARCNSPTHLRPMLGDDDLSAASMISEGRIYIWILTGNLMLDYAEGIS